MNLDEKKYLYDDIRETIGDTAVESKFVEEQLELIAELTGVIMLSINDKPVIGCQIEKYIDEMADSIITMEQKTNNLNLQYLIDQRVEYKLKRASERLKIGNL